MSYIEGASREQRILFPEALDEYISEDNAVRFIDAYVDGLEMEELGFKQTAPKETGRPPYDPRDLLKLYIYGYLNRLRTSRMLERECGRNVELMWLMRKLRPDFKTIADFRKENRQWFRGVFRQFVLVCKKMGLLGGELVAVDGASLRRSTADRTILAVRNWSKDFGRLTKKWSTTSMRWNVLTEKKSRLRRLRFQS